MADRRSADKKSAGRGKQPGSGNGDPSGQGRSQAQQGTSGPRAIWQGLEGFIKNLPLSEVSDAVTRSSRIGRLRFDIFLLRREREQLLKDLGSLVLDEARLGGLSIPAAAQAVVQQLNGVDERLQEELQNLERAQGSSEPSAGFPADWKPDAEREGDWESELERQSAIDRRSESERRSEIDRQSESDQRSEFNRQSDVRDSPSESQAETSAGFRESSESEPTIRMKSEPEKSQQTELKNTGKKAKKGLSPEGVVDSVQSVNKKAARKSSGAKSSVKTRSPSQKGSSAKTKATSASIDSVKKSSTKERSSTNSRLAASKGSGIKKSPGSKKGSGRKKTSTASEARKPAPPSDDLSREK